jgi:hypothetical protein
MGVAVCSFDVIVAMKQNNQGNPKICHQIEFTTARQIV